MFAYLRISISPSREGIGPHNKIETTHPVRSLMPSAIAERKGGILFRALNNVSTCVVAEQ